MIYGLLALGIVIGMADAKWQAISNALILITLIAKWLMDARGQKRTERKVEEVKQEVIVNTAATLMKDCPDLPAEKQRWLDEMKAQIFAASEPHAIPRPEYDAR